MGSRNRQRATFEKRQREIAKKERQAEKRARRQGRIEEPVRQGPESPTPGFPIGQYPEEIAQRNAETPVDEDSEASTSTGPA